MTIALPVVYALSFEEGALSDIDDLLLRVGRGDRVAFRALAALAGPRLLTRVRRVVHDPAQAEEIVQDVLLRVWQRAAAFDPNRAGGWTWLYAVARNRAIDVVRQASRVEPDWTDPALTIEPLPEPDRDLAARRRQTSVRDALGALPEAQREVLELAYFESMTLSQIAQQRSLSGGTVKSRVRLAFEKLRTLLSALDTP